MSTVLSRAHCIRSSPVLARIVSVAAATRFAVPARRRFAAFVVAPVRFINTRSSLAMSAPAAASAGSDAGVAPTPIKIVAGQTRVGWIGTGVMGNSMCGHLMAGLSCPTTVYNRTESKTATLAAKGARVAKTVEEVGQHSDVVFAIVAMPSDVRRVFLGDASTSVKGLIDVMQPGSILVDMTTSEPALAREIHAAAAKKGICALDAPVSGGDIGAREARLSIMVGGDQKVLEEVTPMLQTMGKNITLCGGAGAGQHTKMVNQILIANGLIGVVEGLLYAQRAGLDPLTVISAVQAGAAGSWSITNLGPKIVARDFKPGFFVEVSRENDLGRMRWGGL